MSVPFWADSPEAWDQVVIAGDPLPGRATVKAKVGRKLDIRNVRGADGARTRDGGYDPAKITIEVEVWTAEQLAALQPRLEQIHPRRYGTARSPVDIAHPSLTMLGIASCYVESISAPEVSSGRLKTTITAVEWTDAPPSRRARPPAPSRQNGASQTALDRAEQQEFRAQLYAAGEGGGPDALDAARARASRERPLGVPPSSLTRPRT